MLCVRLCLGVRAFTVEEEISSVAVVMYIVKRALQATAIKVSVMVLIGTL